MGAGVGGGGCFVSSGRARALIAASREDDAKVARERYFCGVAAIGGENLRGGLDCFVLVGGRRNSVWGRSGYFGESNDGLGIRSLK